MQRKIGANKGKPRLWIEGRALLDAGMDHGSRWNLTPTAEGFTITEDPEGKRKIAGKPGRPIVDITGKTLTDLGFATGDVAALTIAPGSITITKGGDA